MRWTILLSTLCLFIVTVTAGAQETTGSIEGQVVDAQKLPVSGAAVTITTPQGPRSLTTDSDGRFRAAFLTPGDYRNSPANTNWVTCRYAPTRMECSGVSPCAFRPPRAGPREPEAATSPLTSHS